MADLAGRSRGPGSRLSGSAGVAGTSAPYEQRPHRSHQDEDVEPDSRQAGRERQRRIRVACHSFCLRFQARDAGRTTVQSADAKSTREHRDFCRSKRCSKRSEYNCRNGTARALCTRHACAHWKSASSRTVHRRTAAKSGAECDANSCWAECGRDENRAHSAPRGQIEIDWVTTARVGRSTHA